MESNKKTCSDANALRFGQYHKDPLGFFKSVLTAMALSAHSVLGREKRDLAAEIDTFRISAIAQCCVDIIESNPTVKRDLLANDVGPEYIAMYCAIMCDVGRAVEKETPIGWLRAEATEDDESGSTGLLLSLDSGDGETVLPLGLLTYEQSVATICYTALNVGPGDSEDD